MEIKLLNEDFKVMGVINDFYSLIWRRKYNEPGDFELHCNHDVFELISSAAYVYRSERNEVGIIENRGLQYPNAYLKGRFIERLLYDEIIYPTAKYTGKTHEYIARDLMSTYMPDVILASANSPMIGSAITTQVTGDNLMEYLYKLLGEIDASFSLTCDPSSGELSFSVRQGSDRRGTAIFAEDWHNLKSFSYEYSDKDFRNYAIVAGAGDGAERQVVTIDNSNGGRKRKLFVDARDLQPDEDESADDYTARLTERGAAKLAEYRKVEKVDAEVDAGASPIYLEEFDVGDLCTIKEDKRGIVCVKRITECEEVYEHGAFSLSVRFGDGFLSLSHYIERRLKS